MAVTAVVFDVGETLVDETRPWRTAATHGGVPEIAYAGDRVDNDVLPAKRAGMFAVHIRRGPWGYLHEAPTADARIDSLTELPGVLP